MSIDSFVKEKVANNFTQSGGDREAALDPSVIIQWIAVIRELIPIIAECKNAFQLKEAAGKPVRITDRAVLNWNARRVMGGREFRKHGRATVEALIASVKESSVDEIQALYDEV